MLKYFKNNGFQKALRSHTNYQYSRPAATYNTGDSIAIMASVRDKSQVQSFVTGLRSAQVHVLFYDHKKPAKGEDAAVAADTYTAAQVQWSGVPTGEVVEVFLQREYDRLYYLSFDMPQCQYYIYRLLKVRLSIGPLLSDCDHSFDLNIELKNEDISTLIKEVKKGIAHLTGM